MYGIGGPGTPEAQLWHDIAGKHGIICPYGPYNQAEWNHCQPTRVKVVLSENPLRETVTAEGPISLEGMFEIGNSLIASNTAAPAADLRTLGISASQRAGTPRLTSPLAPPARTRSARNPIPPRNGRSIIKGNGFKLPPLAHPPDIYVEEGRRSGRNIPLVQIMPRSSSRSISRNARSPAPSSR